MLLHAIPLGGMCNIMTIDDGDQSTGIILKLKKFNKIVKNKIFYEINFDDENKIYI